MLCLKRFRSWLKISFVFGERMHSTQPLHFKPLMADVWSVRVNQNYRALGRRKGSLIVWFWIGTHAEYDQLLKRL